MKTIILILTLAAAASAQQALPCLIDTAPPGLNATEKYKDGSERTYQIHKPEWKLRPGSAMTFKVANGGAWFFDIYMPVAGNCVGYFTSYDNSDDLNAAAAKVLSGYIDKPKGDIEILILTPQQLMYFGGGNDVTAAYSSGRRMSGKFDVFLPAGYYTVAVSNRHSKLAPKSVDLILGDPKQIPKTPAP